MNGSVFLPLQKDAMPSDFIVLTVQSTTPLYGLSRVPCLSISPWFCTNSLTRSMGAAAVLETAAATPDNMKFSANPNFCPPPILSFAEELVLKNTSNTGYTDRRDA